MTAPFSPLVTGGLQGLAFATELGGSIALGLQQQKQGRRIQKNLRNQARQIELIGILNARKRRSEGQHLLGAQIAAFAKSGVAAGAGSALDIELRTRAMEELAALEEQLPYRIRAEALRHQGKLAKKGARGKGIQTILGGLARAVGQLDPGVSLTEEEFDAETATAEASEKLTVKLRSELNSQFSNKGGSSRGEGPGGTTIFEILAPEVSQEMLDASLKGARIRAGTVTIIDLAPDLETLGPLGNL